MPERKSREILRPFVAESVIGPRVAWPVGDAPDRRQKYFFRSLLILAGDFVVYYLTALGQ
jgi:hypothetical protein